MQPSVSAPFQQSPLGIIGWVRGNLVLPCYHHTGPHLLELLVVHGLALYLGLLGGGGHHYGCWAILGFLA